MSIRRSTRTLVVSLMLGVSIIANSAGPARAGATPDVPFVDDLTSLQPVILTNLAHIHTWLAQQPCRYYRFDETYDSLAAEVNGFLTTLSGDIARNNFHEESWKAQSTAIIDQLKKFNDLLTQTQAAIEANSLPPPAQNCPYNTLQANPGAPAPPPPKPQFQISIPVSDLGKMINDAQSRRIEGQVADDQQRAQFASQIMQQKWPQECQLSLQGKKLPCLEVMSTPTPGSSSKPSSPP
jgi:hypothetical protein